MQTTCIFFFFLYSNYLHAIYSYELNCRSAFTCVLCAICSQNISGFSRIISMLWRVVVFCYILPVRRKCAFCSSFNVVFFSKLVAIIVLCLEYLLLFAPSLGCFNIFLCIYFLAVTCYVILSCRYFNRPVQSAKAGAKQYVSKMISNENKNLKQSTSICV